MTKEKCIFFASCVDFGSYNQRAVDALEKAVDDAIDISAKTFFQHVSFPEIRDMLGYASHPSRGLTLSQDWHISYQRTKLVGFRSYLLCHSSIDYFYVSVEDFEKLDKIRRSQWQTGVRRRPFSLLASQP